MALFVILALSLSSLLISTSISNPNPNHATTTITASLSPFPFHRHSPNLSIHLHRLSTASLHRARRLKEPTLVKTPLSPRGYGGYSVSLRLGSPPQAVPAVLDTGSSLVWVPCTPKYQCSGCDPSAGESRIEAFSPENSSSCRNVSCRDPGCSAVLGPAVKSGCCGGGESGSEQCPGYDVTFGGGAGSTLGFLITDVLDFGGKIKTDRIFLSTDSLDSGGEIKTGRNFLFGCSVFSSGEPSGNAGFGRGRESLPEQMGVRRFSYCSLSHRFDDDPKKTTDLVLDISGAGVETAGAGGMTYTPFRKNPAAFKKYYYLTLRRVVVGDAVVGVPYNGPDGNGGDIVDSGTTFTYMERPIFDRVAGEFERRMNRSERAVEAEMVTGLGPCYHVSADKSGSVPKLALVFESGAEMVLPLADYFSNFVGTAGDVVCLTIVSDDGPTKMVGPAIILGNYQQPDFYVEYDLENDRFGFKEETCG